MKVLVATTHGQGDEAGDYNWTVEGELVTAVTLECCNPECGCQRGFPGLGSSRASTTAMVVERDHIDLNALREAVKGSLRREGWLAGLNPYEQRQLIASHLSTIRLICRRLPVGTVIRRSGTRVWSYQQSA